MAELDVLAAVAYYIFIIIGSISSGYLVVRFSYPDVRTFSNEEKLGASALLGAFIGVLSVLADVFLSGLEAVLSAKGHWPIYWLSASVMGFGIMYVGLRKPKEHEIAVPTTKRLQLLQTELESIEVRPPDHPTQIQKKLEDLRKKGVIAEPHIQPLQTQPPQAGEKPPVKTVEQNVREAKRVLEKAREVEVETILKDLQLEPPEQQVTDEGHRHRMYLMKKNPPKKDDEKQIVEDVYTFEEAAEKAKKKDQSKDAITDLGKTAPQKELPKTEGKTPTKSAAAQKAAGAVTMADLFGEAPAPEKKEQSVFAQMESQVSVVPTQKDTHCPTCKQKNSRIVFCPYCGTGLCANCSPSIVPGPEGFTYTCPKCQEDILVKKKPMG
ncbi:zinc ribbon domain-containing protein [Candidatus Micrarchaeota archaeon]|nr:zinc ribbon domain-containing protein [Candidatus Micrarchaeota archaeon]